MKAILLVALTAIVLSQVYGLAYADHGGHHYVGESVLGELSVGTDSSSYASGEIIQVSGSVSDYDELDPFKNFDVTLRVIAPNNNIISISQIPLNNDGSYSTSILADGPLWKFDGEYTISATHGSETEEGVIEETEEEVIEISEEELQQGCGDGTHLEDGICVLDETVETTPVTTGSSPSTGFNSWIYSISFTILIAFAIMIILYLISRASRNKNDN